MNILSLVVHGQKEAPDLGALTRKVETPHGDYHTAIFGGCFKINFYSCPFRIVISEHVFKNCFLFLRHGMILGCRGGLWLSSWCHIHDSGLFWGNNSGTFLLQVCIKHNLLSFVVYHRYETIAGWETIQNVYESLSTLRRLNIKISSMFSGKAMTPLLRHLGQDELWTMHK